MFNKKLLVFNIFYWKYLIILYSQQEAFTFIGYLNKSIEGTVKINYNTTKYDTATIFNNQFVINGHIDHSVLIILSINDTLYSDWFYLDAGLQKVSVGIVVNRISIASTSKSNMEHTYFKLFEDSLKQTQRNNLTFVNNPEFLGVMDTFLFQFVKGNPNSYVGLDKLNSYIRWNGSNSVYFQIYRLLSKNVRSSIIGRETWTNLNIANKFSLGKTFPSYPVFTMTEHKASLTAYMKNNKYVLIDIWSYSCAPCIQQFKELIKIYKEFKFQKFEIIGISTDSKIHKQDLMKSIQNNQLLWPQLWDIDNIQGTKYKINYVPNNYLLDSRGKIVAKNISIKNLNDYLIKELHK